MQNWIDDVVRDLCELPDRNSPDDHPEMMLVTPDEIREAIQKNATSADGSLTVEDAICGVLDLFPSADSQALRVLGELLSKPPNAEVRGAASRAEGANLTDVLERWSKWILNNPPYIGGDHACAECYPNSDIIKPGFVCVYHEAEHWRERYNESYAPSVARNPRCAFC